mgnify:CR=1 FL=1
MGERRNHNKTNITGKNEWDPIIKSESEKCLGVSVHWSSQACECVFIEECMILPNLSVDAQSRKSKEVTAFQKP